MIRSRLIPLTLMSLYAIMFIKEKMKRMAIIMIRAAICDDEPVMLDHLHRHISAEFVRQGAEVRIEKFTAGRSFLEAENAEPFDVVFLDIDMPEIGGFEIAEKISEKALIIFVTSHDELVFSSLKFRPFRFIRKTHLDDELPETLSSVIERVAKIKAEKKIEFQTKDSKIFLPADEIEYIEVYGHWLRVLVNAREPVECYGSLSEFENLLAPLGFVRTYKSYLVNLKYVYSLEKTKVVMDDKTEIPLSRYKAAEIKEKFKEYLRSVL